MKNQRFVFKVLALTLSGTGLALGGYWAGLQQHGPAASGSGAAASGDKIDPKTGRKVLYWHDPMVPGQKFDKPGKSPFMDMQLVPVYADEGAAPDSVKVSPALQQNLGIRLATVRRAESRTAIEAVGTTQFNEGNAEVIQSRVTAYVDHLYARAPQQRIKRGEPIVSLFAPEWIAPQEEYLALKRAGNEALAEAARQRMRVLSIPDSLIARLERSGQVQRHFTLTAPVTGVITELGVREGAMVQPGVTIAKVAGLDRVWLVADIPEALAGSARPGMTVEATTAGDASRSYAGKVREILPGVSATTRTVQARLELDNRDGSLMPGMLMRVRLGADKPVSRLLVPTEAVITTGKRAIVFVAGDNNAMQPVAVTTGRELGDDTEILTGLAEGQKVVASGQFLIDSEASLKAVLPRSEDVAPTQKLTPAPRSPQTGAAPLYRGVGRVEKVSPENITFSHGPIAALNWPAMTMDFAKPHPHAFADVKAGEQAEFAFKKGNDAYVLEQVTVSGGSKK